MSHHPHNPIAVAATVRLDAVLRGEDNPWPPTHAQKLLLEVFRYAVGKHNAITRVRLAELVGEHDRTVRDMIRSLRLDFGVAIGTSRERGASGYYLVSNSSEAAELTAPLAKQAANIFRLYHALTGRHATAELAGQLRMELQLDQLQENKDTHVTTA